MDIFPSEYFLEEVYSVQVLIMVILNCPPSSSTTRLTKLRNPFKSQVRCRSVLSLTTCEPHDGCIYCVAGKRLKPRVEREESP